MIPVNTPLLDGNEKRYLIECIDSGWISSEGPFVNQFEDQMASYMGREHAIACANGSAALDIAIQALSLPLGSEVIMPTFTIISCAQSIIKNGLMPVAVDCDPRTFNVKVEDIASKVTSKTSAIMVVHLYGLTVDIQPILDLAKERNLKVIEDAAQMIGQEYRGKKCGSFGDISTFSFYPNKLITTGEGGMVLTNDIILDERARKIRNLCFGQERFIHDEIGYNYRMTNLQAAVGVAQLEKIERTITRKREIGRLYNEALSDIASIHLPIPKTEYCENIYWVYPILLKDDEYRVSDIMNMLQSKGIGTRPFFYPMHQQPVFNEMGLFKAVSLPNSEAIYKKGFYIPSGIALQNEEIEYVSDAIREVLL
ncbi:DegT/DnrJ/EryC1/StrS family aminotransferase [Vibrio hepatarius]|uniref:DegT/DnrJ/EryC1/StrS family aminotransferase n=1 Tax=Vibrio hepatarius TaxID=171383 RepID=UPI001C091912|nr:DegT/DnrJ/EryC1/StrS family aminotransferase [Vibrio hepatarius]MBU2896877.1 DegT/DnrJ/EryC1/StrS family aminotransferase [Vibrio hepatarius]